MLVTDFRAGAIAEAVVIRPDGKINTAGEPVARVCAWASNEHLTKARRIFA